MKYRDPESGTVLDRIRTVRAIFCVNKACVDCPLEGWKHGKEMGCLEFCDTYPEEAAKMMGYEVIEGEMEMETKQDKPRICEVLGVEVGERFDVKGDYCYTGLQVLENGIVRRVHPDGSLGNKLGTRAICYLINHPECIVRRKQFTEQEIEDAKAIKRLLPKIRKIRRDCIGTLCISGSKCEYLSFLDNTLFQSIAWGESYTLDEIIGEG